MYYIVIINRSRYFTLNELLSRLLGQMFMHMMGGGNMNGGANGQAQNGYGYAQPAFGAEEMRGMINDAVMAMLPNIKTNAINAAPISTPAIIVHFVMLKPNKPVA